MPSNNIQISQSTFETIDTAVYNFVNGQLDIYTKTNNGLSKVPVLWLGAERAHQIKNNKDLRDKVGKLKLPLLTISRTGVSRDTDFRGSYRSYYPPDVGPEGGRVAITRIIRQDKTRNFAVASGTRTNTNTALQRNFPRINKKVVIQTLSIPIPVYVNVDYKISIKTEYQQQMNELLAPFITRTGQINSFVMRRNGHVYEAFIDQGFTSNDNVATLNEDIRMFGSEINIKVLGYLIGEGDNDDRRIVRIDENVVELTFPRESVPLPGEPDFFIK